MTMGTPSPRGRREAVALLLLLAFDRATGLDSGGAPLPPIITPFMREVVLREITTSLRHESPHAEWHTRRGEFMLAQLLSRLKVDGLAEDKSRRWPTQQTDYESLWLLCRSQLGCIEGMLKELGEAYERVGRVRLRWRRVAGPLASLAANHAVARGVSQLRRLVTPPPKARVRKAGDETSMRKAGEETKGQQRKGKKAEDGWELEDEWESDDKEGGALPAASRDDVPTPSQANRELDEPLGGRLTRIGLGTRRRALLRSERALACHAGALHDLRVALREAGGEWLELGRWVGGPPLASMPWDVQPSRTQHEYLLRICARVASQLRATAATLHRLGPYALYSEPFPRGSVDVEPLASRRATLVATTRDALDDLWMVRKAVREGRPPPALLPPNVFARHSLVWAALLLILVDGYAHWLPVLLAARHDAIKASIKVAADARRFWSTHVTEPLGGIARELFHGYESTIDKAQVAQTKAALARMLQEFVRDTHPSSSDRSLEEALRRAGQGSMEAVTIAFENQVKAPVSSLLNGQLIRSMLLLVQQLRLLMEEEVEAIDSMLKRNDFNMQLMATLPALMLMSALLWLLRTGWRKVRSADRALRDPLDTMQAEVLAIDALLIGAEWTPQRAAGAVPRFQRDALSQFEVTPMELGDVGEIVFRVQRLRKTGAQWLRGIVRREMLQDAQVLLDSARLSATQRSRVAQSLLRRFDNFNSFRDYW